MRCYRANGIQLGNAFLHRKEWEFVIVCQALEERNLLRPAKRGIGFAVGTELLPALFAGRGCEILATDHVDDSGGTWTGMWAKDKNVLRYPDLCPPDLFEKNIQFRRVDMTAIPSDITGYDFSWSCCAFEHLGNLQRGIDFLESQMKCLKPGGWAVHTTEYNLLSDDATLHNGKTVVYRRCDIQQLIQRMNQLGHYVEAVDFSHGDQMEDFFIAHKPWDDTSRNLAHLRIVIGQYVCTSIVLIMQKGPPV